MTLLINPYRFNTAGPTWDADAAAWFAAMTTAPTSGWATALNQFVIDEKADGSWALTDWLLILAGETSQAARVNARNPAKLLSAINGPTFTASRGFQGDGASSYLDLGEAFSASGNQFGLSSASMGAWCNLVGGTGLNLQPHIGQTTGAGRATLNAHGSSVNAQARINDSTDSILTQTSASRLGHRAAVRNGGSKRLFMDGGAAQVFAVAATTLNTSNGRLLSHGSTSIFSPDRLAAAYTGAALSDAQIAGRHTRLSTLLTPIGAA